MVGPTIVYHDLQIGIVPIVSLDSLYNLIDSIFLTFSSPSEWHTVGREEKTEDALDPVRGRASGLASQLACLPTMLLLARRAQRQTARTLLELPVVGARCQLLLQRRSANALLRSASRGGPHYHDGSSHRFASWAPSAAARRSDASAQAWYGAVLLPAAGAVAVFAAHGGVDASRVSVAADGDSVGEELTASALDGIDGDDDDDLAAEDAEDADGGGGQDKAARHKSSTRANPVPDATAQTESPAATDSSRSDKQSSASTWSLVLRFCWQDAVSYLLAVAFSTVTALLGISEANLMKSFFDSFSARSRATAAAGGRGGSSSSGSDTTFAVLQLLSVVVAEAVCATLASSCLAKATNSLKQKLREHLLGRLLEQDEAYFDHNAVGAITDQVNEDVNEIGTALRVAFTGE